jgi:hypothetical protein
MGDRGQKGGLRGEAAREQAVRDQAVMEETASFEHSTSWLTAGGMVFYIQPHG